MRKTDVKAQIAQKHRAAIKSFMAKRGLKVSPWCKKAGITEGALRNFLNGDNDSMGANNLELLARVEHVTVGQLLGEESHFAVDDDLMRRAADVIIRAASSEGRTLTLAEAMAFTVMLYKHILKYRQSDEAIEPNEATAALILNQAVS